MSVKKIETAVNDLLSVCQARNGKAVIVVSDGETRTTSTVGIDDDDLAMKLLRYAAIHNGNIDLLIFSLLRDPEFKNGSMCLEILRKEVS